MTQPGGLEARIAAGREKKARRFARALWESWTPEEKRGDGLRRLKARPREWWRELAASIGAREPSQDTVDLIISKIEEGTRVTKGLRW